MQCHLQGKAWAMQEINTWFDFRPGQLLETNRSVYFPVQTSKEQIEVGDSPHRLSLSNCFKKSKGKLTCITCHNPHYSIKSFTEKHYNGKCISCHTINNLSVKQQHKHNKNDNCISCHMNQTGKENTLHGVSLTDHWIRVDAGKTKIDWTALRQPANLRPLIQLVPDVDANDDNKYLRKGIGYLDYYFEYDRRKSYLDSAIHYLQMNKEALRNSAIGNFSLGEVYVELNNYNAALKAFTKAAELYPEYSDAYFKTGKVYSFLEDYNSAIYFYKKAVKLKPEEPPYLESLGLALIEMENFNEAVKVLENAVSIDKQNAKTFYTLGYLYAIYFQQPEKALKYFEKSVSLDQLIEDGYLNLGNTYSLLSKYNEALDAYKKEIIFNPSSASAYVNSGRIYQLIGEVIKAKSAFKKALEIEPELTIAKELLEEL
jgi:tetratricopeptide (TPR) repeat protein